MEAHNVAVSKIATTIKSFHERKQPFRIYHGSTNSTRPTQHTRSNIVDTSGLTHVLSVDTVNKTVLVEPNVGMDALVAATLPHGLVPPIVMEFPGITTGGGFSGTSGESSSFRHGFFDQTVNNIEIVLGNGEVMRASRTDHADLLRGAASAFGTMGVVTMLEIKLVEAKKFVKLVYHRCRSVETAFDKVFDCIKDTTVQYLDAIVFKTDWVVVCEGKLIDAPEPDMHKQTFLKKRDPWFYLHAKRKTRKPKGSSDSPYTEAIPIVDYLFRYDRGGFWTGRYAFRYFCVPFDRLSRYIVNRFMHTRVLYHALHASGMSNQWLVQDVSVPIETAEDFIAWLDKEYSIYPLWLCPLLLKASERNNVIDSHFIQQNGTADRYLMNIGVWGQGSPDRREFIEQNRRLEQKVHELGGQKCLYAHAYYTEKEFWEVYDKDVYDELREKYQAQHLPTIFDKVKVNLDPNDKPKYTSFRRRMRHRAGKVWPVRGIYGVYKAWRGKDYVLTKEKNTKVQGTQVAGSKA